MSLVTPLKRTAIIVRDMPRSLQFYRDVLGLNVWIEGRAGSEIPALYQLLGMPECTTHWIILQSGNVDWGMVGLFELSDPAPADETHPHIDRANRGEACLVFHSPNVRAVYRGARKMGLTVLCPPTRLVLKAHGVESLEMTLRDPNGVLVNLIQNIKGGSVGLSNRFPGLARPPRKPKSAGSVAVRRAATTRKAGGGARGRASPRRSAASKRGRSE
jgi:catechol 2,3-dioxygenase-like lactoylglutathione lyase family enzyme